MEACRLMHLPSYMKEIKLVTKEVIKQGSVEPGIVSAHLQTQHVGGKGREDSVSVLSGLLTKWNLWNILNAIS